MSQSLYSVISNHVTENPVKEDLKHSVKVLNQCDAAYERILSIYNSASVEENEAKSEIYDLITSPDIIKLNKLFNAPINILPPEVKYNEKLAKNSKAYFKKRADEIKSRDVSKTSPASEKFDSCDNFEAFEQSLESAHLSKNNLDSEQTRQKDSFELEKDIERCSKVLDTFESKFSSMNVPEIPNKLNENVHANFKTLGKIVGDLHKFTEANMSLVERVSRIQDAPKILPASRSSKDIEEILCLAETLSFPSSSEEQ